MLLSQQYDGLEEIIRRRRDINLKKNGFSEFCFSPDR
jgi:hypothetical protein